jgi:hypothetical protein
MCPFRRINFDDVRVPHNQQRAFFAVTTQTSHKVWPLRIEREDFGFDAFTIQDRFQVFNHDAFIAGWIAGVQAQNRLEVAHGFFFDLRPIRLRRFLKRSRIEQDKQSEQSQTSERHEMPSESDWFLRLRRVYDRRNSTRLRLKIRGNLFGNRKFRFFLVYILQAEDRRPQLSRPPLSAPDRLLNGISQMTAKLASRPCEFCG